VYYYTIEPTVALYEIGIGGVNDSSIATAFGPVGSTPLVREMPEYSATLYGWLGVAGATACCLTHAIVIPLDVVKTRAQTASSSSSSSNSNNDRVHDDDSSGNVKTKKSNSMIQSAVQIAQEEGIGALLLGAQATLAGYFWYGLSVYPAYTFAKRTLSSALPPEVYMAHGNEVALVAGALAAVVASFGLTPLEAARIRVVANPTVYRPLGLVGTLRIIAIENGAAGGGAMANLYAGLPSLLTRQVIFGSVKFLAFERAYDFIFAVAPELREATWTTLAVSLVAGGLSGILSSVVSQPADCLLTYVAKGGTNMGLIDGAKMMIAEQGPGSLFRGLGSRCVWAGSIIAGQFLLYDVFRTVFGVNSENLNQVFQLQV
jgi:solute carrier family 25 (mitochondrial phosphate transporter), member 3